MPLWTLASASRLPGSGVQDEGVPKMNKVPRVIYVLLFHIYFDFHVFICRVVSLDLSM